MDGDFAMCIVQAKSSVNLDVVAGGADVSGEAVSLRVLYKSGHMYLLFIWLVFTAETQRRFAPAQRLFGGVGARRAVPLQCDSFNVVRLISLYNIDSGLDVSVLGWMLWVCCQSL